METAGQERLNLYADGSIASPAQQVLVNAWPHANEAYLPWELLGFGYETVLCA